MKVNKEKEIKKIQMFDSFMKVMTFVVVMHGLTMVSLSYLLAFMDKEVIAEGLSQTVVTEIVGPFTVYGITKTIENVSKYNDWIEKIIFKTKRKEEKEDELDSK